ncbi:MAG: prepilin-type N-terminal cleavage/methylation domain-containing protein [Rickettsiales bacterium]
MKKPSPPLFPTAGFSLIELSAVIAVAATVTVGYLSWTQPKQKSFAEKSRVTEAKMRTVASAIEAFKVKYGRLPCPADPYQRRNGERAEEAPPKEYSSEYGMENMDEIETDALKTLGSDCPFNSGMVPAYALELSEDYFLDGWDRRFTYQVSRRLCGSDAGVTGGLPADVSRNKGCTRSDFMSDAGDIIIKDGAGNRLRDNAAYVLLSHGRNGYGAFLPSGARVPFPPGASATEKENANAYSFASPAAFNPAEKTFVDAPRTAGGYDDIIYYRTKAQIETLSADENRKLLTKEECDGFRDIIASTDFDYLLTQAKQNDALNAAMKKGASNPGDAALMMILDSLQRICGNKKYYNYSASDYRCPKDAKWNATTQACECLGADWDNCQP